MAYQEFEGVFWAAKIELSNRWGERIVFTSAGSDGFFQVPRTRVASVASQLRAGVSPDSIAKSLPIDA